MKKKEKYIILSVFKVITIGDIVKKCYFSVYAAFYNFFFNIAKTHKKRLVSKK